LRVADEGSSAVCEASRLRSRALSAYTLRQMTGSGTALDTTTPIVIFGLSRGVFDHGALGITRSAGRLRIPVHRVARERWTPARASRYVSGWRTLQPDAGDEQILASLKELREEIGRAILIAVDDAASVFVDTHAERLHEQYLFPHQPSGLAQRLSSKREMYELCTEHRVPAPLSFFPQSESELSEIAAQLRFPTVVKCVSAGDTPANVPRVVIAQDHDELVDAYRLVTSAKGSNGMLQEYIPGTPESVWMFNGYFGEQSECRVGLTGRKIRQSPPYTGVTTLGVCVSNATVHETTVALMKAVGYRGILDIGFRFDERDRQYKLLDVNPRIGNSFRLFVGQDGTDVLRTLYRDLTGQGVPHTAATEGRRWLVEPLDVMSSIVYRRRGDLTLLGWIRSLRGVREAAWFAADDPLPFLALLATVLLWLPRRRQLRR
jgi:D-aspartate ligase